uniref:Uncharacterized protein n=1 Tax=Anopheles maculatus TaxID=74869 RepID=A0A182TAL2_9DIPT
MAASCVLGVPFDPRLTVPFETDAAAAAAAAAADSGIDVLRFVYCGAVTAPKSPKSLQSATHGRRVERNANHSGARPCHSTHDLGVLQRTCSARMNGKDSPKPDRSLGCVGRAYGARTRPSDRALFRFGVVRLVPFVQPATVLASLSFGFRLGGATRALPFSQSEGSVYWPRGRSLH